MEQIKKMMHENKIKHSEVEYTGEKCEGCGKDLKIVQITFADGEVKENESGCICDRIKFVNDQQKKIKADAFAKASIMHGDDKEKTFDNYQANSDEQVQAAKKMRYYANHFD